MGDGVGMGWKPRDADAVDTLDDWRPFLLAARAARVEGVHWTLDPLEFRFIGQVVRAKRGPLWVYVHEGAGGDLSVDADGGPHHVKLDRAMRIRTKAIGYSPAVWRTGMPQHQMDRDDEGRNRQALAGGEWPDSMYDVNVDDSPAADLDSERHLRLLR